MMEWVPGIAAFLLLLIGVIFSLKPRSIIESVGLTVTKRLGMPELRAVFGAPNLAGGIAALYYGTPEVYALLSLSWFLMTVLRVGSIFADGCTAKESLFGIFFDLTIALMLFCGVRHV